MKNLLFNALLWLLIPTLASAAEHDQKSAKLKVYQYIEYQTLLYEAALQAKDVATFETLDLTAKEAAEGLTSTVNDLKKLELNESQRRQLASVAATQKYEIYGNRDMPLAIQSAPADLQAKIIEVIQPYLKQFIAAEKDFSATLLRGYGNESEALPQVEETFDDVFRVSVLSLHRALDQKTPAHGVAFLVRAEHLSNLDSMDLFEHVIPWNEALPSKEELKKWISFDAQKRIIVLTYPGGTASYQLPRKRKQSAAKQPSSSEVTKPATTPKEDSAK